MDEFTMAYITAALWSSTDDEGEPLDKNYDIDDIDDETLRRMEADTDKFQIQFGEVLVEAYEVDETDEADAGHNFWLTRNGHGAGFWDGDYPDTGDELTDAATSYGEFNLYVGDDDKIYG